eukprot:2356757-Prymnesium_polylepis.1
MASSQKRALQDAMLEVRWGVTTPPDAARRLRITARAPEHEHEGISAHRCTRTRGFLSAPLHPNTRVSQRTAAPEHEGISEHCCVRVRCARRCTGGCMCCGRRSRSWVTPCRRLPMTSLPRRSCCASTSSRSPTSRMRS